MFVIYVEKQFAERAVGPLLPEGIQGKDKFQLQTVRGGCFRRASVTGVRGYTTAMTV